MADNTIAKGERRPSPKALLELAAKETRGKLKIFLGMAPGVGKTYAMLSAAQAQKANGVDVVVGVIETHGRSETAAQLEGLEVLPRRQVSYRNRTLMEFDLEAALSRRPKLLLIDELAHTNAPGLLHGKRYQDVEEALREGIDVWTTLNIQHVEGLGDVVARITGITVRETVPDKVLERADEIVVIDLPPEELIQRLKEGKVYVPENARRAIDQFFKPSNLTALRELALRRTTDRVDEQMLTQLRQQGIEGPWPTAERLLVCVGSDEHSEFVVRAAGRMASALKSDWVAVNVKRIDSEVTDRKVLRRTDKAMRLAERLGARTVRLSAKDLTAEILTYAKRNNITQIVIGRSDAGWLDRLLGRALSKDLVLRSSGLSVTVVSPETVVEAHGWKWKWPDPGETVLALAAATLAVSGAVLAGHVLERITELPNISMVFLLSVILCALNFGVGSAVAAALLSCLAYNFFFIEPYHSFNVAKPHEFFALLIFLFVAVVTGGLAGRLRDQAAATRSRAESTEALFDFSRKLSGAATLDDVLWLLASQVSAAVRGKSIILMHDGVDLVIRGGWPPEDTLPTPDWAAARWAFKAGEKAGFGTGTMPAARFQFRTVAVARDIMAVIGVEPGEGEDGLSSTTDALLQAFIDQAAIAIERTLLVEDAARAAVAVEAEGSRAGRLQ